VIVGRAGAHGVAVALLLACRSPDTSEPVVRGIGLAAADLTSNARAEVYRAALDAAFDLEDPTLTLLLDPRLLPRTPGFAVGDRMPPAVVTAIRGRGSVMGTCEPPVVDSRVEPRCTARGPGYVVRFSDVLRVSPDSVQVYLAVQRFDLPSAIASHHFKFEKAYQLTGTGETWRAAREGRVPDPGRGN
jgi:hypothetical protein